MSICTPLVSFPAVETFATRLYLVVSNHLRRASEQFVVADVPRQVEQGLHRDALEVETSVRLQPTVGLGIRRAQS